MWPEAGPEACSTRVPGGGRDSRRATCKPRRPLPQRPFPPSPRSETSSFQTGKVSLCLPRRTERPSLSRRTGRRLTASPQVPGAMAGHTGAPRTRFLVYRNEQPLAGSPWWVSLNRNPTCVSLGRHPAISVRNKKMFCPSVPGPGMSPRPSYLVSQLMPPD